MLDDIDKKVAVVVACILVDEQTFDLGDSMHGGNTF
jgi:hypothetical protein